MLRNYSSATRLPNSLFSFSPNEEKKRTTVYYLIKAYKIDCGQFPAILGAYEKS
jgi:hypothetical protein